MISGLGYCYMVMWQKCCLFLALILSCAPEVLLTSANATLSLTDRDGNTALHLACSNVSVHMGGLSSLSHVCLNACACLEELKVLWHTAGATLTF